MGRHTAADGAAAHPLVAAALAGRSAGERGAHRGGGLPGTEGPVGWPGRPATEGGGIGWPGDLSRGEAGAPAAGEGEGGPESRPGPGRAA